MRAARAALSGSESGALPVDETFVRLAGTRSAGVDAGGIARRRAPAPARGGEVAVEVDAGAFWRVPSATPSGLAQTTIAHVGLGPVDALEDAAREQHRLGLLAVQPGDQQAARPGGRCTRSSAPRTERPYASTRQPPAIRPDGTLAPMALPLDALRELVGPEHVLTSEHDLVAYSTDATPLQRARPEAVVLAGNRDEIAGVLRLAEEHRFPVTPRASGTNLSGGAVPLARRASCSRAPACAR